MKQELLTDISVMGATLGILRQKVEALPDPLTKIDDRGYYLKPGALGNDFSTVFADMEKYPIFDGIFLERNWGDIALDFSSIDTVVNWAEAHGKKVWLWLQFKSFGGSLRNICPAEFTPYAIKITDGMPEIYSAPIYEEKCVNALCETIRNLRARYDHRIAAIDFSESAPGNVANPSIDVLDSTWRQIYAAASEFKYTQVYANINWFRGREASLIQYCYELGLGLASTDSVDTTASLARIPGMRHAAQISNGAIKKLGSVQACLDWCDRNEAHTRSILSWMSKPNTLAEQVLAISQ